MRKTRSGSAAAWADPVLNDITEQQKRAAMRVDGWVLIRTDTQGQERIWRKMVRLRVPITIKGGVSPWLEVRVVRGAWDDLWQCELFVPSVAVTRVKLSGFPTSIACRTAAELCLDEWIREGL